MTKVPAPLGGRHLLRWCAERFRTAQKLKTYALLVFITHSLA